jgi:hypothetical protein
MNLHEPTWTGNLLVSSFHTFCYRHIHISYGQTGWKPLQNNYFSEMCPKHCKAIGPPPKAIMAQNTGKRYALPQKTIIDNNDYWDVKDFDGSSCVSIIIYIYIYIYISNYIYIYMECPINSAHFNEEMLLRFGPESRVHGRLEVCLVDKEAWRWTKSCHDLWVGWIYHSLHYTSCSRDVANIH